MEANDAKQIDGDDVKLLEGTSQAAAPGAQVRSPAAYALAGLTAMLVLLGALAANDVLQANEENAQHCRFGCGCSKQHDRHWLAFEGLMRHQLI